VKHDLRRRAEAQLASRGVPIRGHLARELELHKLELELLYDELRRAQYELEAVRHRYQEVFERAPAAYLTVDSSGQIGSANGRACALTGVAEYELVGTRFATLIAERDTDRLRLHLVEVRAGGSRSTHLTLVRRDGSMQPVRLDSTRGFDDTCLVVISEADACDGSHRPQLGVHAETLTGFVSVIAHEANNMLQVLRGVFDHLRLRLAENHPAGSLVETGIGVVERGRELITRLLSFGRHPSPRRLVQIDQLVANAIGLIRPMVGDSIGVTVDLGAPASQVLCDPTELELALLNLAINARDAMPSGGELVFATREVSGAHGLRWLVLAIRDTGRGMSDAVQRRAFEPFFTTKSEGQGTGLGLATTQAIVQSSGGNIAVTSVPGRGTTFRIQLPIANGTGHLPVSGASSSPQRRDRATILVVEDNSVARQAMCEHLETLGYRVLAAGRPSDAITAARQRPVDVAIVDWGLPEMSGETLAHRLREIHPELPVVLTSGYPPEHVRAETPLLQKPFGLGDLARVVAAALTRGVGRRMSPDELDQGRQ